MGGKYTIGVDFGSLSVRAVLFSAEDGRQAGEEVSSYARGVMETELPDGTPLPPLSALQDPNDYITSMAEAVRGLVTNSGIPQEDIIGLGVDFTSCSLLAVDEAGEPLCNQERFRNNPHAYVKMWKQHTASVEADEITRIAKQRGEPFLRRYGSRILSEWAIPKILETAQKAPEVYQAAHCFMEAGDWINRRLTGKRTMNYCMAGLKFLWDPNRGYPSDAFFQALDPAVKDLVREKLCPESEIYPLDVCMGKLTQEGAELTSLAPGTAVAPARIDGHSASAAVGVNTPGKLVMIIGTGMGMTLLSDQEACFKGLCGVSYGAVIPGLYGYEAGLSGCGDIFQWCAQNCANERIEKEAEEKQLSVLELLTQKASGLCVGENGLLALDWWNGNRSVLADTKLSGVLLGLTLQTKPEDIFRAVLEATGFSARMVVDNFDEHGLKVSEIYAVGGIAQKNSLLMQIYADVLNRDIRVADCSQACALGSAIFAAAAAGKSRGGYDTLDEAIASMHCREGAVYHPDPQRVRQYEVLFEEFRSLHDYFGRGGTQVLNHLYRIKGDAGNENRRKDNEADRLSGEGI